MNGILICAIQQSVTKNYGGSMATLEKLDNLLSEAANLLDQAGSEITDLHMNSEENLRKIGEALVTIFEIRLQIFKQRPDLTPDYLKK